MSVQAHINRTPQEDQSVFYTAIFKGEVIKGDIKPRNPREISEVRLFRDIPDGDLVRSFVEGVLTEKMKPSSCSSRRWNKQFSPR